MNTHFRKPDDSFLAKMDADIQKAENRLKKLTVSSIIINFFSFIAKFGSKIFRTALILFCLAHFVPELRTAIPTVYQVTDLGLACIDKLFGFVFGHFL